MSAIVRLVILVMVICSSSIVRAQSPEALIAEYRALPADMGPASRNQRSVVLEKLKRVPADQRVAIVGTALADEKEGVRREELLRVLWDVPSAKSVEVAVSALSNPDPETRKAAVQVLRHFSTRIDRRDVVKVGPIPERPAKLDGVVPHLMFASHDSDVNVRRLALVGLADSRDPAAVARFREVLGQGDPVEQIDAARLLAEFGNPAGLDLLKRALLDLPNMRETTRYMRAEQIIPALMRLTGQDFGRVPMIPSLSSSTATQAVLAREFDQLIHTWMAWAATPPATVPSVP